MALHLIPADEPGHALIDYCWCDPDVETVDRPDGTFGKVVWHFPHPSHLDPPTPPGGGADA